MSVKCSTCGRWGLGCLQNAWTTTCPLYTYKVIPHTSEDPYDGCHVRDMTDVIDRTTTLPP